MSSFNNLETLHNIEHEKRLIDALGYTLIGPDKSNRYQILDENEKPVGFIQYKKIHNQNKTYGHSKTFGYQTEIDSDTIEYKNIREIRPSNLLKATNPFIYIFKIKRGKGHYDKMYIEMSENPILNLWSEEYGDILFKIDSQEIYLNYKSQAENFNIEELVLLKTSQNDNNYDKKYVYQIRYCKKPKQIPTQNVNHITIREITGKSTYSQQQIGLLSLTENTWVNNRLRLSKESEVEGTIEELVYKHEMGIDAFNHFRFLLNQIIPFKQEVLATLFQDRKYGDSELELLVPEAEKQTRILKK